MSAPTVVGDQIEAARWSSAERVRIAAILGVIAALHVGGISLYLLHQGNGAGAGGLLGSGVVAYVLGMRHAFDADHIAAIDDTTRVMMTVGIALFIAAVYISQVLAEQAGWTALEGFGAISEHFEVFGYGIAVIFTVTWVTAIILWKRRSTGLSPSGTGADG